MKKIIIAFLAIILVVGGFFLIGCEIIQKSATIDDTTNKNTVPEKIIPPNNLIQVSFPSSGEKIGGTLNVTGIAKGIWYFEGDFPVRLVDSAGRELAIAPASAQSEWMKEDFVPFSATLKYPVSQATSAKLILAKDNPSDMRELDDAIEIPVVLEPEISSAKIFFSSQYRDADVSLCDKVFPVGRSSFESMAYARQALEALLAGPTEKEKALGYSTVIPAGVKIQNFDASTKIARIDLSRELLNLDVDVACRRILIQTQITETLKNASGAESVFITVDGQLFPGEFSDEGPG